MDKTELNPEICTFCAELAGIVHNSNYFRLAGHDAKSRILWRNSEFALIPSLGPLAEGHLLLIPTYHTLSFANLPKTILANAENLVASVKQFFSERGRQILVFEHGSLVLTSCDYEKRRKKAICGACTDHAHIHIVPSVSAQLVISTIEKMHVHTNKTTIKSLLGLREELDPALAYILIGGSDTKSWLIFALEYVPSQFMRKLVASLIGLTEWDWRQFPHVGFVKKSIQEIGPHLKDWLQSYS
jgi:diadenosine tetraphosphate (Ap4A) HIT family hydrolase